MINFHLHDSVKVKAGTADPDFGNEYLWVGRDELKKLIRSQTRAMIYLVAWDSLTPGAMGSFPIVRSENEGLS